MGILCSMHFDFVETYSTLEGWDVVLIGKYFSTHRRSFLPSSSGSCYADK